MLVSINEGGPNTDPKCYDPCFGDPQDGALILGNAHITGAKASKHRFESSLFTRQ